MIARVDEDMVACPAEPGSNPPDARLPLFDAAKGGNGNGPSVETDSQISGASTRKGLRQYLAEITDSVMLQATSVLKKESKNQHE